MSYSAQYTPGCVYVVRYLFVVVSKRVEHTRGDVATCTAQRTRQVGQVGLCWNKGVIGRLAENKEKSGVGWKERQGSTTARY